MDDLVEYHFDSIDCFNAELDDLLSLSCHNDKDAISITDRYIKLIMRYQSEFIHSLDELSGISHRLLDSNLFLDHTTLLLTHITFHYAMLTTLSDSQLVIPYSILYYAGVDDSRWMTFIVSQVSSQHRNILFHKIVYELQHYTAGHNFMCVPFKLLYEIGKMAYLGDSELKSITVETLRYIILLVESAPDEEESFVNDVMMFILVLNNQYRTSNIDNMILNTMAADIYSYSLFAQNLMFILNRETDTYHQSLILHLLHPLLTRSDLSDIFYTNDLYVLVDIVTRSIERLDCENDSCELLNDFLRVLKPLLMNTSLQSSSYKRHYIYNLLCSLVTPYLNRQVHTSTLELVNDILECWWKNVYDKPIAPILGVHVKHAIIESKHEGETGIILSNVSSAVTSDSEIV
ncbi:hypothetical protein BDB01DRAFT_791587 [Pilobolus umbonatus]|nr:hypothetical protein BDB01DRAFT_791587 [Pilobolus umbonatus]